MIRRPPRSTLFPTRRSSDLIAGAIGFYILAYSLLSVGGILLAYPMVAAFGRVSLRRKAATIGYARDRKSTRLNSSHDQISYAVFCLKKNKSKGKNYDDSSSS